MRENFEVIPTDILENTGVLKSMQERFEKNKNIYTPRVEDFKGVVPDSLIEDDAIRLEQKKKQWDTLSESLQKEKMIADIFEGIVVDQFSGSWLGNKAEGYYTSEADDVLRGVDVVAEIKTENEESDDGYLGLALDVTFSEAKDIIQKKLDGIWDYDVTKGKLGEVRYFEKDDFKGPLQLPRIIISADRDTVRDLVRLYHKKDRDGLEKHQFQYSLLAQIKIQLESYYQSASLRGHEKYKESIAESLRLFYEIYDAKEQELQENIEAIENDEQFQFVSSYCKKRLQEMM